MEDPGAGIGVGAVSAEEDFSDQETSFDSSPWQEEDNVEADQFKTNQDGRKSPTPRRTSTFSLVFSGIALGFIAVSIGLEWTLSYFGVNLGWGTTLALLSGTVLLVFLRPSMLASVICSCINVFVRYVSGADVTVSVGMIDVRGLTISDISVNYAQSKQLLFAVKEISLSFDTSDRGPLHVASAPLFALNVKTVVFHGDNELAKLSGLQQGPSTPVASDASTSSATEKKGKAKKKKRDRIFWMLRLVILRLDNVRLELEGEDFTLGVSGGGICLSFLPSQQQTSRLQDSVVLEKTKHRRSFYWNRKPHKKTVLPRVSMAHFGISFLAKETQVAYPLVSLTELCLSLSSTFSTHFGNSVPGGQFCGCQVEHRGGQKASAADSSGVVKRERTSVKVEEVELRIEKCGVFVPAILVKLLAELRSVDEDSQSLQEDDDRSSVASSMSSSIMSQLTFLGNHSKLARLTQATAEEKRSTRSDSTDSNSWECVNCSFYNSEVDTECLVCGYNGDGEKLNENGNTAQETANGTLEKLLEAKLAKVLFDLPTQCVVVLPHVVLTLEGDDAISPHNPYTSPGSFILIMGMETSVSSRVNQVEAETSAAHLMQQVHVEHELTDIHLTAQDVLSEQLLSKHKGILRVSHKPHKQFSHQNFVSMSSFSCQIDLKNSIEQECESPSEMKDAQVAVAKKRHALWPAKRGSPQQENEHGDDGLGGVEVAKLPNAEWECSSCSFVNMPSELSCGFCGAQYLADPQTASFRMTTSADEQHGHQAAVPSKHSHKLTIKCAVAMIRPLVVLNPSIVDHAVVIISLIAPLAVRPKKAPEINDAEKSKTLSWCSEHSDVTVLRKAGVRYKVEGAVVRLQAKKRPRIRQLGKVERCEVLYECADSSLEVNAMHFIPSGLEKVRASPRKQQHVFLNGSLDVGNSAVKQRVMPSRRNSSGQPRASMSDTVLTLLSTHSATRCQFQIGNERGTKLFDLVAGSVQVPEIHCASSFADAFYFRAVLLDVADIPRVVRAQSFGVFKKSKKGKAKKRKQGRGLAEWKEVLVSVSVSGIKCCCQLSDGHQPLIDIGRGNWNVSVRPNAIKSTNSLEHVSLKLKAHTIIRLEAIQLSSKSSFCDLNINRVVFTLPPHVDFGEVIQGMLLQRKAFRTACSRFDNESFTLDSGNISPAEESPRPLTQRSGLRMLRKRENSGKPVTPSKSRRRVHLRLSMGSIDMCLLQSPSICDQRYSREIDESVFPKLHARSTEIVSVLCRLELSEVTMDLNYSWKEHRRSELLKRLWAYDDCRNLQQATRAHEHGFSFVSGLELSTLTAEFVRLQLRNHASPLVFAKNLSLQTPSVIVLAALKPTECCTRWETVVLGRQGSKEKSSGGKVLEVERCQRSSVPIKVYFDSSITVSALDVNHGECLADSIRNLDEAMGRLLPKSSDKTSPKLGWWDKLRYLLHGVLRLDIKLFLLRLLTRSPWHGETGIQFQLAEVVAFNSRDSSVTDLPTDLGPANLHWSEILSADTPSRRPAEDEKRGSGESDAATGSGEEFGSWAIECQSFIGSLVENTSDETICQYDLLHVPLVHCTLSLYWVPLELTNEALEDNLLDHYVQLHHPLTKPGDTDLDMYKYFRANGLELGIRVELGCARKDDVSVMSGQDSGRRRRVSITQSEQAMEATKLFKEGVITEEEYELLLQADKSYKKETTEHTVPDLGITVEEFKAPSVTFCWPAYDLLSDMIRVIAPPGAGKLSRSKPAFGRLLKKLKVGILADNPRLLWWETAESDKAILAHAKSLVTKLELERPAIEGWSPPYGSPPGWNLRALLVQSVALNGHFIKRVSSPGHTSKLVDASGVNWEPWTTFPFPYATASEFMNSQDHFLHCKAFMLTRGQWGRLLASSVRDEFFSPVKEESETTAAEGFRIRGDECRLVYTLDVRDTLFHFIARVARDINEQSRIYRYLASKSITGTSPSVAPLIKTKSARSSSVMHLRTQPSWRGQNSLENIEENDSIVEHDGVQVDLRTGPYKAAREPSEGMKSLLRLSTSRKGRTPSASSSSFVELLEQKEAGVEDEEGHRPRRDSFQSYASSVREEDVDEDFEDLPHINENVEPDLLVELRWPQVNLVSGKDSALLGGDHGDVRLFKTTLDCDVEGLSLLKRELSIGVAGAKIYVAPNEAESKRKDRWVKLRSESEALCVENKLADFGFRFEILEGMPLAPPDPDPTDEQGCQEVLSGLAFTVNDTSYTAVAANNARSDVLLPRRLNQVDFPANVIAVQVPSFAVRLNSFEFFTVLGIIRNLLLVPPSHNLTETHPKKLGRRSGSVRSSSELDENNVQLRARSASSDDLLQGNESFDAYDKRVRASTYDCELSLSKEATMDDKLALALSGATPHETFIDEKLVKETEIKFREAGQELKYLSNLVKGLYSKHREALNRRERHILYNIDQGTISLYGEMQASELHGRKGGEVERVKVLFTELKGIHKFDMVDCTKVHVSLQTLELIDCQPSGISNTGILVGTLKHSTSSSRQAPFLRVEAYTAPPLRIGDYKVNLYRRLQVHLFPGAEYTLRLMLNKSLAYFLSAYFVDEDEDDEEEDEVDIKHLDGDDDKRKSRRSRQKRKKKAGGGTNAAEGELKVKEKVYFHYVRTSRLNILVFLDHVPLVPNSGINLVANGNYNLMVSGIVIHSQLMSWTKLYKHIRNQAIKGVVKSLIIPVKRRPEDPHAIRHMTDKQGEKKADTDDVKELKTGKLLFGKKRE